MAVVHRKSRRCSSGGPNFLALMVAAATIGFGYFNFDPLGIGSEPQAHSSMGNVLMADMIPIEHPATGTVALATDSTSAATVDAGTEQNGPLTGRWALRLTAEMLRRGVESFERVQDYTAELSRQERIGGVLSDMQQIEMKVKHQPFSVYMKWHSGDRGRQLIYVDGQNDGNLLVQPGGLAGRLTGVLHLDPEGTVAMSECRYPATKAGLLALAKIILGYQTADLKRGSGYRCRLEEGHEFDGRSCYLFVCEYESPEANAKYRKSMMYIDQELSMPVCVQNYTWARDANPETIDEETLVEHYGYTNIQIEQNLDRTAFSEENPAYRLRIRK